jgi:hypothetical protein
LLEISRLSYSALKNIQNRRVSEFWHPNVGRHATVSIIMCITSEEEMTYSMAKPNFKSG